MKTNKTSNFLRDIQVSNRSSVHPPTLPPIIMEVKNGCISNSSYLSNIAMFHFHDYGRKSNDWGLGISFEQHRAQPWSYPGHVPDALGFLAPWSPLAKSNPQKHFFWSRIFLRKIFDSIILLPYCNISALFLNTGS